MASKTFAPTPRANAIIEKLCPYHFPYVSKCQTCRAFLHKVSRELFAQENEKVTSQAEIAKLMKKLSENEKSLHEKDLQIQELSEKLSNQEKVHTVPGTNVEWMVHALTSRLNKRLKITPQLLENEETKDCQVDFEGFDNTKLATSDTRKTVVNNHFKAKIMVPKPEPHFTRKKAQSYVPCGTDSLFKEVPTSVTASLGLTPARGRGHFRGHRRGARFMRRGGFKRGNYRDMARFLDDYFAHKSSNNSNQLENPDMDDHESMLSYTTNDQEQCNIALPRSDKKIPNPKTEKRQAGNVAQSGYMAEQLQNMDFAEALEDYEDQDISNSDQNLPNTSSAP